MWAALVGWTFISIVAVALIGIGIGVLSMNPPHYQIAQVCFSIAGALLLVRSAWWIVFEQPSTVSIVQRVGFTIVIFAAIGVLWEESVRWVNNLDQSSLAPQHSDVSSAPTKPTPIAKDEKPPTLLDLFKKDFPSTLKASDTNADGYTIGTPEGSTIKVKRQTYEDYEARTKFIGFYISRPDPPPKDFSGQDTFGACMELLKHNSVQETFDHFGKQVAVMSGYGDQMTTSKELTFSGRVLIYHEEFLSIPQKADILKAYKEKGFAVTFRGGDYLGTQVIAWHQQHDAKKE
jgi:hypothetical protein